VKDGSVVVAIDLRGIGETSTGKTDTLLGDWKNYYLAYLLGQPLLGLHTEDAIVGAQFVANYKTKTPRRVHLVGVGRASIIALHAAALEPDLFASITLRRTLASWSSVVRQPVPQGLLTTTVHGALRAYDLPDLVRSLDPNKLHIEE
jgi:pimeloyl-ACP methyl ester carboxylesterase